VHSARSSLLLLLTVDAAEPLLNDRNEGVDDWWMRGVEREMPVEASAAAAAAAAAHQRPKASAESSSSSSSSSSRSRSSSKTTSQTAVDGDVERRLRRADSALM
jgi:hypothetical protein